MTDEKRSPLDEPIPERDMSDMLNPDLGVKPPSADLDLEPITPTPVKTVQGVWATVEAIVREAIAEAERHISEPGSGKLKKQYVRDIVRTFIQDWEDEHNKIPNIIEPFVMKGIFFALDMMIERVLAYMKKIGEIPA